MVARWFLGFALALQVFASVSAAETPKGTDYRNWTYEKQKSVVDKWDKQFEGTKKNLQVAKNYANNSFVAQWNENDRVRNMVRDSGIDPDTGKKIRIEANVTQTANKAKVASTLVERLKKAKDFAKHAGKASIPAFVGGAAFQALMDGVGWVMDEGGKVTRTPDTPVNADSSLNKCWMGSGGQGCYSTPEFAAQYTSCVGQKATVYYNSGTMAYATCENGDLANVFSRDNPNYNPNSPQPEPTEVTPQELESALKTALESNNPALAAAIAQAIKDAYTPDNSPGQSLVDIPANGTAMDATDSAVDAVRKAGKSTGEEPTSGGKPGYYKITDGDKTIEGYVYPTDGTATGNTDSTTVTNPDGSTTTTGSTSLSWPNFCDWAGVVCEFIDWVKEDEYLEEEEPEEIDDSIFDREFDIKFDMGASCPPNPIWNFEFVGRPWSKEIDITMVCSFFKYLGYALIFASNMTALWIVYSAVVVRDQG